MLPEVTGGPYYKSRGLSTIHYIQGVGGGDFLVLTKRF